MRHLIWIAALAALSQAAPAAYAQSDGGTKGGKYNAGAVGGPPSGYNADTLNPTNCGTPDDPKPCAPMPRRALEHYRAEH
jgi:hypothetical protein